MRERKPGEKVVGVDPSADSWREGWDIFMSGERKTLVERANGRLGYALCTTLPGESREELDWLMERTDRRLEALGVELKPVR